MSIATGTMQSLDDLLVTLPHDRREAMYRAAVAMIQREARRVELEKVRADPVTSDLLRVLKLIRDRAEDVETNAISTRNQVNALAQETLIRYGVED